MRKNKIFLPMMAISLLFGLGLAACNQSGNPSKSNNPSSSVPAKEKIKVTDANDKTEGEIQVEATLQLKASVEGGTWASSNTKVATVDDKGLVTAVAAGSTSITVTKEGYDKGTFRLTVVRGAPLATLHFEDADHYAADGWWGDDENGQTPIYARTEGNASDAQCIAHFGSGDKETLTFTSSAAINAELVMTMASSSSGVDLSAQMAIKLNNADISLAGLTLDGGSSNDFQEISLGKLDIATNNVLEISFTGNSAPYLDNLEFYSKQQAQIAVVKPAAKEAIELSSDALNVNLGGTAQINVTKPTDKTGITYTSSNTDYATVSETGLVLGGGLGTAYIYVAKEGMLTARVTVTVTDEPVPGEIRVEAENQPDGFDFESLGFHMYPDGSYIAFAHSGGAYITGYDVTEEVSLSYTVTSEKAQTMTLVISAAPHYNMQAGEEFKFATDATIKLNDANVQVNEDAIVLGDGARMGAKTQNVIIGDVNLKQGDNSFVIEFHGKAPALDCFKFLPKA